MGHHMFKCQKCGEMFLRVKTTKVLCNDCKYQQNLADNRGKTKAKRDAKNKEKENLASGKVSTICCGQEMTRIGTTAFYDCDICGLPRQVLLIDNSDSRKKNKNKTQYQNDNHNRGIMIKMIFGQR